MSLVLYADRTLAVSSGRGHAWALVAEGWSPLPVISWRVELVALVFVCLWLARCWLWALRKPGLAGGPHLCIPIKEQSCGPRLAVQGLGAGCGVCLCGCLCCLGCFCARDEEGRGCGPPGPRRLNPEKTAAAPSYPSCPGRGTVLGGTALVSFLLMFLARWVSVAVRELSVAVASSSLL